MGWFRRNEHDEEQLSAYLDGELSPRQAEIVEAHLTTCEACSGLLDELRATRAMLSALPAQAPSRSFVLGAEYARAPVREARAPSRPLSLAFAPAVALSVFVALVLVDVTDVTRGGEHDGDFTLATARQTEDASNAGSSALAPMVEKGEDGAEPEKGEALQAGSPDAASGDTAAAGSAAATDEATPPEFRSADSPGASAPAIAAAETEPAEDLAPEAMQPFDTAADDGNGVSTLRVLQLAAIAAFLASGFYVFVWPRLSRGGSSS